MIIQFNFIQFISLQMKDINTICLTYKERIPT